MSKNSIIPFLKDYLINFLTSPFLLDTNVWKFYFSVEKCDSGVEDFICRDFLAGQGYIV